MAASIFKVLVSPASSFPEQGPLRIKEGWAKIKSTC